VALGVAESLMLGCAPVIVEGPSDQMYLSAIKTLLIASGRLSPGRELVFPPAGGVKGVKAVTSLLGATAPDVPIVLVDADKPGQELAKHLRTGLYQGMEDRVVLFSDIVGLPADEVEDLSPATVIAREVDRWFRGPETAFGETLDEEKEVVPQIEAWAAAHGVALPLGWKVELARRVKRALLKGGHAKIGEETLALWEKLFDALAGSEKAAADKVGTAGAVGGLKRRGGVPYPARPLAPSAVHGGDLRGRSPRSPCGWARSAHLP
jgi:hypothetical protein